MRFRILPNPNKRLTLKALCLLCLFVVLGYSGMVLIVDHPISDEDQIHKSYCDCGVKCRREACCCRPESVQYSTDILAERISAKLCMVTSLTDNSFPEAVLKINLVHIPKDIQALALLQAEGAEISSLLELAAISLVSSKFFCRLDRPPRFY